MARVKGQGGNPVLEVADANNAANSKAVQSFVIHLRRTHHSGSGATVVTIAGEECPAHSLEVVAPHDHPAMCGACAAKFRTLDLRDRHLQPILVRQ